MRNDYAKYLVIGIVAAGVLCVSGLVFFLIRPTSREITQIEQEMTEAETQVRAQYANRKQLSETVERIKAARAITKDLDEQFLEEGRELKLIEAVEAIGEHAGVVTRFGLAPGGGLPNLPEYNRGFSLSLIGSYRPVMRALVEFERLPYLATYGSVTINGSGETADAPIRLEIGGMFASPPKKL